MTEYFEQKNWEPFVYQRLNRLIDENRQNDQAPVAERAYVVFDFDNTSIINDIEDNLMMYMMKELNYKLQPDEMYHVLTATSFDFDEPLIENEDRITANRLAEDIIEQYEWLYTHYIQQEDHHHDALSAIQDTPEYQTFTAKLRLFYNLVNNHYSRQPGENWPLYLFAGYTKEELIQLAKEELQFGLNQNFDNIHWSSADKFPGKTGPVTTNFETGLAVPPELLDLYHAFQDNNIMTYVVSASPVDVVKTAVREYGFGVADDQVIGMQYDYDEDGRVAARLKSGIPITKGEGKKETVMTQIAPRQLGKQPIAVFGDSMGDYHLFTELSDLQVGVLFNRYQDNATQNIVESAIEAHDTHNKKAKYLLQGRDENKGCLRPSMATIPLEYDHEVLRASDFTGRRSLST